MAFPKAKNRPDIGHGRRAETKAARRLGADLTPNSGAAGAKGDMTVAGFRMESKSTRVDSMILEREWLAKIAHEAAHADEDPALLIQFVDERGSVRPGHGSWVAIPEDVFLELTEGRE